MGKSAPHNSRLHDHDVKEDLSATPDIFVDSRFPSGQPSCWSSSMCCESAKKTKMRENKTNCERKIRRRLNNSGISAIAPRRTNKQKKERTDLKLKKRNYT